MVVHSGIVLASNLFAGGDFNSILSMLLIAMLFILIILMIYLIKAISKITSSDSGNHQPATPVISGQIPLQKDDTNIDDKELIAVITGALMAYLGDEAPQDGLVVRSIRKVNKRN